jgi:hypothetical protein
MANLAFNMQRMGLVDRPGRDGLTHQIRHQPRAVVNRRESAKPAPTLRSTRRKKPKEPVLRSPAELVLFVHVLWCALRVLHRFSCDVIVQ